MLECRTGTLAGEIVGQFRAGQGWHEQIISESRQDSRPVAQGADGKVTEILIGPVRPLLAAAVWR
jgi:hypothetical protein